MPTEKTTPLKTFLLRECLPALARSSTYFSLAEVRACLDAHSIPWRPELLRVYMSEAMGKGVVHDAGRGWYSRLTEEFKLDTKPVAPLVRRLEKQFPLLEFTGWSTGQIRAYGHHLLAKFVPFIHVERDAMPSVFEFLKDAGHDAHLNPRGPTARRFAVRERTVVVRPRVTTQPAHGHYTTIEAILVDLFVESRTLNLMDISEYFRTFQNLTGQARISMANLLDYARERRPAANELVKLIKAEFCKNSALIIHHGAE